MIYRSRFLMFSFYQNLRVVYSQPFFLLPFIWPIWSKAIPGYRDSAKKTYIEVLQKCFFLGISCIQGTSLPSPVLGFVVVVWDIFCTLYILIVCPILLDGPLSAIDIAGRGSLWTDGLGDSLRLWSFRCHGLFHFFLLMVCLMILIFIIHLYSNSWISCYAKFII